MIPFLLFLLFFTSSLIIIPLIVTAFGYSVDTWILNAIAAFIGSLVAVIGSVIVSMISDRKRIDKQFSRELTQLKQELYNNFIVSLHRVLNLTVDIPYYNIAYESFLSFLSSIQSENYKGKVITYGDLPQEISRLYFVIVNGNQMLESYAMFHKRIFVNHKKKPNGFFDILEQIETGNIHKVSELAIIRFIIDLDARFNLSLSLPSSPYFKYVEYHFGNSIPVDTKAKYYLAEQISKLIFSNDSILYLDEIESECSREFQYQSAPYSDELSRTISQADIINDYIQLNCTNTLSLFDEGTREFNTVVSFLQECTATPVYETIGYYKDLIVSLNEVTNNNHEIYLSFLGIDINNDCIDNNDYSRLRDCDTGNYKVRRKSWFIEGKKLAKNELGVSSPYKDTAGSYVYSFIKPIYKDEDFLGVIGADILIDTVVMKLNTDVHTVIISKLGEIIYDSKPSIKSVLEKQLNIRLALLPEDYYYITRSEQGIKSSTYYGKECKVIFKRIFNDQYLIHIDYS